MLSFSLPSLSSLLSSWNRPQIDIPPAKIHDVETAPEKPARTLKHLLKLNHANHAVLYHDQNFNNHTPHILSSSYLLGADANDLTRVYDAHSKELEPWTDSPCEISSDDWRDFMGKREYQRAFMDFFEDELVRRGYDWKKLVNEFLFSGDEPMINSVVTDLGHPLIHLGYAFEMSSREVAMEALSLAATWYSDIHKYLDDPAYSTRPAPYESTSPMEVLTRVRRDHRFDGVFYTRGGDNLETIFQKCEAAVLDHWNSWKMEDPVKQFRESQHLAAALLVATPANGNEKYDFFLVHVLTTSHALRVLLPVIPAQFQILLVRQWWLMTLAIYVAQLRPQIDLDRALGYGLNGRDWMWAVLKAVKGEHSTDAHYVKAIRALRDTASTWGDPDEFYLKGAVRFAEEFSGWAGFE